MCFGSSSVQRSETLPAPQRPETIVPVREPLTSGGGKAQATPRAATSPKTTEKSTGLTINAG